MNIPDLRQLSRSRSNFKAQKGKKKIQSGLKTEAKESFIFHIRTYTRPEQSSAEI